MNATELEEREFRLDDARDPLRTIRGRVTLPPGASRDARPGWVLALHGFKGFMDWGFYPELARRLAASGIALVRFNFSGSGVGERAGVFSEERAFFENRPTRELEDVERVRAWLDSGAVPELDPARRALLGHSMGAGIGLLHAARRGDDRALVLWASVATFRRFPPEVEALWRRQGYVEIPNLRTQEVHRLGLGWLEDMEQNSPALDVPAACRRLSAPALFLHGDQDEAVPLAEGRALFEACPPGRARLEILAGANHTFWAAHPLQGVAPALAHVFRETTAFLERGLE